jgi:DNA repair and recombination protein RAD52
MAGAFGDHLLHSYHVGQAMNPNLVTSGAVSFNPAMHGTPMSSYSFFGSQIPFASPYYAKEHLSEETAMRIAALQVKLDQRLGPEYISQRQGPRGGPKLTYAEGWKIINLANEVFGFDGWSSSLVNITTDFVDRGESGRYNVGVSAVVRVTLKEGVYHEDIGYGTAENSPSKGQALDKVSTFVLGRFPLVDPCFPQCKKEAVTDGLKRALRNFGNLMGNCLYDRAYTQEVVKLKVPPVRTSV